MPSAEILSVRYSMPTVQNTGHNWRKISGKLLHRYLHLIFVRAQILYLLAEKLTFVLLSMSQSFASILAVSDERGGQDASRFDKPRRGGGSRVS